MAKIPHSPEQVFQEFSEDVNKVFLDDLESIALFGSGAKGEYVRKKSDINFLVVLSDNGIKNIDQSFALVKKWSKRNVSVPLFLTESYIRNSLDSFPIEFLNMKKYHKLLMGKDILSGLEISKADLRLKCEEQIKGKLLHLRSGFLASQGKKAVMESLLSMTVPAFASVFTALLELQNIPVPASKSETLIKTADTIGLNKTVFEKVIAVRNKSVKLSKEELVVVTKEYIEEIWKLANIIDNWN